MKLKDLKVGDVCVVVYKAEDEPDWKSVAKVVNIIEDDSDGVLSFVDIVDFLDFGNEVNEEAPKAWMASETDTEIQKYLFNSLECCASSNKAEISILQKDYPEYFL